MGRVPRALRLAGVAMVGVACSGAGDGEKDAADEDVHDIADSSVYGEASPPLDSSADVSTDVKDATVADASDDGSD